jgi:hypothetical protein
VSEYKTPITANKVSKNEFSFVSFMSFNCPKKRCHDTEADKGLVDKTLKIENCEMLKSTLRTHFIIIRLLIRVRARTYLE